VLCLAFLEGVVGDNREVRRGLLLAGFWVLGVTASVALAFAAVGRVASRVAPPGVARLSAGAVNRELGSTIPSVRPPTTRQPTSSAVPPSTSRGATTRPSSPSPTVSVPPSVGPASSVAPPRPPPTVAPSTTTPHNTVTTSQGGTLWTRCSSADQIVYVAAVPRSGYQRTFDVESSSGIAQWFDNGSHRSKIAAECSNGSVHAEVEEEAESGD
jgi:hypothetical protein